MGGFFGHSFSTFPYKFGNIELCNELLLLFCSPSHEISRESHYYSVQKKFPSFKRNAFRRNKSRPVSFLLSLINWSGGRSFYSSGAAATHGLYIHSAYCNKLNVEKESKFGRCLAILARRQQRPTTLIFTTQLINV